MIHSKGAREVSLTQLAIAPNAFEHLQALYTRSVPQSTCDLWHHMLRKLAPRNSEPLVFISAPVRVVALTTINVFVSVLILERDGVFPVDLCHGPLVLWQNLT